jgi:hypothetical protein
MAVLRPAGDFDTSSYEHDMAVLRQRWQWVVHDCLIAAA